ncbi:LysR family transcriptional regulator [Diaphorobacter aerolatus]|uniref:LysR family transcriptional regulator n=1 Tax=Diaphorobacter aerolatus TaxID=1288495 RepID=A0A7H0GG69_9BURK|nr:LysR family transcriptional regulator [Diaphorobacter aerolatus]QNP47285.1 LysR family transcriptional regulator [Diaphorobacter aerolatus]
MAMNIKYRAVKAFLLVAESRSFTHAAGALGVTQPSLSAQIQDLEDTLGLKLLERSTRSVALTQAGEEFLQRIQRPLADVEEAYRSALDLSAARRGTVIVAALPSAAFGLVPHALARLRTVHPALQSRVIEAHTDQLLEMLRTNQVECAIGPLSEAAPDLHFEPLLTDGYYAVFPHGHALVGLANIRWEQLLAHDLVLLARGSNAREQFDRGLQAGSHDDDSAEPVAPRCDVTHIITAASMARHGLGVALLPRLALPELNLDGLVARPIFAPNARRVIGLMHRRDRVLGPATRYFIEQLRAVIPGVESGLLPLA